VGENSDGLAAFEDDILHCSRCGSCRAACPLVRALSRESAGARGKISLLEALLKGELESSSRLGELMAQCLLCGACASACPQGVRTDGMILAAREDLSRRGLMPPTLQAFGEAVGENRNISGEDNEGRLIWAQNLEGGLAVAEGASVEVLHFVGCLGSFFPSSYRVPQALTRILGTAGVTYDLLGGEEWCCGYPLLMIGMADRARELIEHNVEVVRERGVSPVVMSCPSCYHAWEHLYPQVLGEEVGVEVLHATEFLDSLIEKGRLPLGELPMRVTYHDPCDLGRKGGIIEAPRRILKAIPGLELVEMADHGENSLCCGGGSNLETYDADLMRQVSGKRLEQALDTEAEAIITACTQCERTLTAAARKERARVRVMDITELVWKAVQAAREAEMA